MVSFQLDKFLSGHVYAFLMIFSRLGSALMLVPGIGESFVNTRARLFLAFSISFLMLEPLLPRLPLPPESVSGLAGSIGYEVITGIFFGTLLRVLMSVLETAGMVITIQSGLSNAQIFNPALASQSPLPSAFLGLVGITMIFVTGMDHAIFRALVALYDVFPPNGDVMAGDMTQLLTQTFNKSFTLGIELAMPFFVIGLLMYVALGLMQKIMPQVQLFLMLVPVQIWGGLTLMGITFASIITIWLKYFDNAVSTFVGK